MRIVQRLAVDGEGNEEQLTTVLQAVLSTVVREFKGYKKCCLVVIIPKMSKTSM